jgi:hypothetical protein
VANENWTLPDIGSIGLIQDQNSGMCLATDGAAGDQPKSGVQRLAPYQRWYVGLTGEPDRLWGRVVIYERPQRVPSHERD